MVQASAGRLASLATRTALLAGLWWLITQGRMDAWLVGLPAVALAGWASIWLGGSSSSRLSLGGLLVFTVLFLRESVRGGLDVARRTLGFKLRITPGFHSYRLHISHPPARVLLINCIGLLPGTLAADIDDDHVELHLLDSRDNPDAQLLRLEQAVARVFETTLEKDNA